MPGRRPTERMPGFPPVAPAPGSLLRGPRAEPKFCDDFDDGGDLTERLDAIRGAARQPSSRLTRRLHERPGIISRRGEGESGRRGKQRALRMTMFGVVKHGRLSLDASAERHVHAGRDRDRTLLREPRTTRTRFLARPRRRRETFATLEEYVGRHDQGGTCSTSLPHRGAWTRVVVDLDLAGGKASISFGAQKALDAAPSPPSPAPKRPSASEPSSTARRRLRRAL